MEVARRKLYEKKEDGWIPHAIVAYEKTEWVVEQCHHGEVGHSVVIEWKHRVQIDLWLFIVRKEWSRTKPNKCPHKEEV